MQEACGSWYAKWQYKAMMPVQANWICWKFRSGQGFWVPIIFIGKRRDRKNVWSSKSKVDLKATNQTIRQCAITRLTYLSFIHKLSNKSAHLKLILYDDSLQQTSPRPQVLHWWCLEGEALLPRWARCAVPTVDLTMSVLFLKAKKTAFRSIPTPLFAHAENPHPHHCIIAFYCIRTKTLQICAPQPADTRVEHRETAT